MKCSHPGTDPGTVCLIFSSETPSRSGLYQEKENKITIRSHENKTYAARTQLNVLNTGGTQPILKS